MSDTPNLDRLIDPYDVSIPEGWRGLVEDMAKELLEISPNIGLGQVKSKFGGLRAYLAPSESLTVELADKAALVIGKYELLSFRTCERCGQAGAELTRSGGWARTLCAVHEVMEK